MTGDLSHLASSPYDFGQMAGRYESWYSTPAGLAHDRVQKKDVRHLLRPGLGGERLLDVGCGTGHWSSFFASMGYQVTGVDISPEMIAAAKAEALECSFEIADACNLPFEDGAFAVAASMATLEFVADPPAMVREMARCTKPGGSLIIGTLNRLAPLNQQRLAEERPPYSSANVLTPQEVRKLLQPYGKVRMAASSVEPREKQSLNGPFIIAEVRT